MQRIAGRAQSQRSCVREVQPRVSAWVSVYLELPAYGELQRLQCSLKPCLKRLGLCIFFFFTVEKLLVTSMNLATAHKAAQPCVGVYR